MKCRLRSTLAYTRSRDSNPAYAHSHDVKALLRRRDLKNKSRPRIHSCDLKNLGYVYSRDLNLAYVRSRDYLVQK